MQIEEARQWAHVGVLAAFALLLSYVETFVPIPIPGVKLGLANIVVLVALVRYDTKSAFFVAMVKVLAAGFLFGSPIMMAYSVAGTLLAFAAMALLIRVPGLHLAVVSAAGGMLHNVGQLAVASVLLGTPLVWYSLPILLVAGCLTGTVSGLLANQAVQALEDADESAAAEPPADALLADSPQAGKAALPANRSQSSRQVPFRIACAVLVVYVVAVLNFSGVRTLGASAALALAMLVYAQVRPKDMLKALKPLAAIALFTMVFQVISFQEGDAAFAIGGLKVTYDALHETARMLVRLACIVAANVAFMRVVRLDEAAASLARLSGPLSRIGIPLEGLMLAVDVAMRSAPDMVEHFRTLRAQRIGPEDPDVSLRAKAGVYANILRDLAVWEASRADSYAEAVMGRMSQDS
ncbi:Gx transporter family protein [Slackia heliotrinireducens]|uniref:Gx transporter family protein n=1 Tax=Slackia heliotrinireducens TaxID=84110 RepID=UPI0033158946